MKEMTSSGNKKLEIAFPISISNESQGMVFNDISDNNFF